MGQTAHIGVAPRCHPFMVCGKSPSIGKERVGWYALVDDLKTLDLGKIASGNSSFCLLLTADYLEPRGAVSFNRPGS